MWFVGHACVPEGRSIKDAHLRLVMTQLVEASLYSERVCDAGNTSNLFNMLSFAMLGMMPRSGELISSLAHHRMAKEIRNGH
jgi:hypothetical protein